MKPLSLLLVPVLALFGSAAFAQTHTSTMKSNATVAQSCKIVAAPDVAFGDYDSTGLNATLPIDVDSYISVVCTRGSSGVRIQISTGVNDVPGSPATNPGRRMKSGNQYLNYQVYYTPLRSGGVMQRYAAYYQPKFTSLDPLIWPLYFRLFPGQSVRAGDYVDTVTTTIFF